MQFLVSFKFAISFVVSVGDISSQTSVSWKKMNFFSCATPCAAPTKDMTSLKVDSTNKGIETHPRLYC